MPPWIASIFWIPFSGSTTPIVTQMMNTNTAMSFSPNSCLKWSLNSFSIPTTLGPCGCWRNRNGGLSGSRRVWDGNTTRSTVSHPRTSVHRAALINISDLSPWTSRTLIPTLERLQSPNSAKWQTQRRLKEEVIPLRYFHFSISSTLSIHLSSFPPPAFQISHIPRHTLHCFQHATHTTVSLWITLGGLSFLVSCTLHQRRAMLCICLFISVFNSSFVVFIPTVAQNNHWFLRITQSISIEEERYSQCICRLRTTTKDSKTYSKSSSTLEDHSKSWYR